MVKVLADELSSLFPHLTFVSDVQQMPGDIVPPLIGGFRPDVVGCVEFPEIAVIGEAKTDADLENPHSHAQIFAFLRVLENQQKGLFVLSVTGFKVNRAKTLLRFLYTHCQIVNATVSVYDGLDFWILESPRGIEWRLS